MAVSNERTTASGKDLKDEKRAMAFLEEFAWLLSSYPRLDFRVLPDILRGNVVSGSAARTAVGGYASSNPNKQFLVGALPRVLTDETLFPTNEDIAQFAQSVMDLTVPRFGKKSKYEIIGHIVCETDRLDDRRLSKLVSALAALTEGDDRTRSLITQRKAEHFGWNEIIQELASVGRHG